MDTLLQGYGRFRERADRDAYCALCSGQAPHSLVIICSDSRIVPEDIFDARPGELFVLRNVGNLARTDEPSVAAALDYALLHLGVKNVVVLAHTDCGAVKATRHPEHLDTEGLRLWLGEEHFDGADVEEGGRSQAAGPHPEIPPLQEARRRRKDVSLPVFLLYRDVQPGDLCQRPVGRSRNGLGDLQVDRSCCPYGSRQDPG